MFHVKQRQKMKQYFCIFDNETNVAHSLLPFDTEVEAKRAVVAALRKPETVYAQFPEKFSFWYVGYMSGMDFRPANQQEKTAQMLASNLALLLTNEMEGK